MLLVSITIGATTKLPGPRVLKRDRTRVCGVEIHGIKARPKRESLNNLLIKP